MSKARLVITAVVVEQRSQAEVARAYGVSRGWVSKLVARYRTEGDVACEPRSRRPHTSPRALTQATVELIAELREKLVAAGLDAGPHTIAWHLSRHHNTTVSPATISRYLHQAGLVTPQPQKRPRSSYTRFEAAMPNECWQSDFTHYRLTRTDGSPGHDCEILTWLDDHSRYALSVTAHHRITGPIVLETFRRTIDRHGIPATTLTDNGMVYTTRFAGGRGGRTSLEAELRGLGVQQKNSRPHHPTTCGKVERFQQTMKNWLAAQPAQPHTITELQTLIETFLTQYNHHRPHRSLPQRSTPVTAYTTRPKATPGNRDTDTHWRTRHDHIDANGKLTLRVSGRLHHIGIGRAHAHTPITMLVADYNVRVIHASTGTLLRELTIDPTRDYQPRGAKPGPPRKTPRTQ